MGEGFITSKQLAEYLEVSTQTLQAMVKRGDVPEPDIGKDGGPGIPKRWRKETIKKWEDEM